MRSSIVSCPVTPMMHVFSRHVLQPRLPLDWPLPAHHVSQKPVFLELCALIQESRIEHISVIPPHARSPNYISF